MKDIRYLNALHFINNILSITMANTAFITTYAVSILFCNFIYYTSAPDTK